MVQNKLVSVIIPTYNRAHLVGRAIQSILNQTYQCVEIIIVDDASTDNTKDVIKEFQNKDKRIKYIRHKENKGAAIARNTGIKSTKGEYIAFQDSDDEWLPEKLERQMKVFETETSKLGIVYTDMWRVNKKGEKKYWHSPNIMPEDRIIYREALKYKVMNIGIQTAVIKKECFFKCGMFDEKLPRLIDLDFFIRLSRYYYFYHINEPLVTYFEVKGESISHNQEALIVAYKVILKKYFNDIKKDKKTLAQHYLSIGISLCKNGKMRAGRRYLIRAFLAHPLSIKYMGVIVVSLFGQNILDKTISLYKSRLSKIKNFRNNNESIYYSSNL